MLSVFNIFILGDRQSRTRSDMRPLSLPLKNLSTNYTNSNWCTICMDFNFYSHGKGLNMALLSSFANILCSSATPLFTNTLAMGFKCLLTWWNSTKSNFLIFSVILCKIILMEFLEFNHLSDDDHGIPKYHQSLNFPRNTTMLNILLDYL